MNVIEAMQRILAEYPHILVLALSNHVGATIIQAILKAGGLGYVYKNLAAESLIPAIRTVAAGEQYIATA